MNKPKRIDTPIAGEVVNDCWLDMGFPAVRYEDMNPLAKAKVDMDYCKRKGGFAYKQAKRHYERLKRKG